MRRTTLWMIGALLAVPAAARAQADEGEGRSQTIMVDPESGEVRVESSERSGEARQRDEADRSAEIETERRREKTEPVTRDRDDERDRRETTVVAGDDVTLEGEEDAERFERRVEVAAQAGLLTYTGEAARLTDPGATYGVSVAADLVRGVSAEIGYVGASYGVEGSDAGIAENGAQGLFRVGPEYGPVSPYAMWGLAVTALNAHGPGQEASGVEDATMLRLPIGAGVRYALPSDNPAEITLGLNVAYKFTLDAGAFPGVGEPSAANQFTSNLSVGGRF